ncbi:MAG TPA: 16S rRNA (adenine(1518)-N(6)/adenine(1519)-N(6))-dimethyltransferase RsmA [Solirubrobacterales bacterium]|nr:16S rRNA (adenine(1518)-N(6)/adenine(1519)-N(6))-dimethyltransferase RsmA [Solirubrobacterales bacterium]
MRLGQNFLADTNLLDAIVRESGVGTADVVLEVGAGEGVLTRRLAAAAGHVHAIELDRGLSGALSDIGARPNVDLHWADVLRFDLGELRPAPTAVVANLPYSVATPVIVRTLLELPSVGTWTVMVQREIADRLRAQAGSRLYGAPSAILQTAADVTLARRVDPAVFKPRPRVESAILRIERTAPPPPQGARTLVREAFAHRRKSLPRSLELAQPGRIDAVRSALRDLGLPEDARAERLSPQDFLALAAKID